MQSGLFWGYVDMVEGLVRRMKAELGGAAVVVATGGLASVVAPESTLIEHVDPELTLRGLRLVLGTPDSDRCRILLPRTRSVSLPQERRPPDSHHRPGVRAGAGLGAPGRAAQGGAKPASIATSSATTARARGGGPCASSSAKPTCSTRSTTGAARSASRASCRTRRAGPMSRSRSRRRGRGESLASQIESALARLTVLRGSDKAGPRFGAALDAAVRALDALRPDAARARGEARDELMRRVAADRRASWPRRRVGALDAGGAHRAREGSRRGARAVSRRACRDEAYRAIAPPGACSAWCANISACRVSESMNPRRAPTT